jgi:hypothetical protein
MRRNPHRRLKGEAGEVARIGAGFLGPEDYTILGGSLF